MALTAQIETRKPTDGADADEAKAPATWPELRRRADPPLRQYFPEDAAGWMLVSLRW